MVTLDDLFGRQELDDGEIRWYQESGYFEVEFHTRSWIESRATVCGIMTSMYEEWCEGDIALDHGSPHLYNRPEWEWFVRWIKYLGYDVTEPTFISSSSDDMRMLDNRFDALLFEIVGLPDRKIYHRQNYADKGTYALVYENDHPAVLSIDLDEFLGGLGQAFISCDYCGTMWEKAGSNWLHTSNPAVHNLETFTVVEALDVQEARNKWQDEWLEAHPFVPNEQLVLGMVGDAEHKAAQQEAWKKVFRMTLSEYAAQEKIVLLDDDGGHCPLCGGVLRATS